MTRGLAAGQHFETLTTDGHAMKVREKNTTDYAGPKTGDAVPMSEGFDLEERTAVFGESIIAFCRLLQRDDINSVLTQQPVRSGTSVGANYC